MEVVSEQWCHMILPTAVVNDSGCAVHDALQFIDLLPGPSQNILSLVPSQWSGSVHRPIESMAIVSVRR